MAVQRRALGFTCNLVLSFVESIIAVNVAMRPTLRLSLSSLRTVRIMRNDFNLHSRIIKPKPCHAETSPER